MKEKKIPNKDNSIKREDIYNNKIEFFIVNDNGRVKKGFVFRGNAGELQKKLEELIKKYGPNKPLAQIIDELFGIDKVSQN